MGKRNPNAWRGVIAGESPMILEARIRELESHIERHRRTASDAEAQVEALNASYEHLDKAFTNQVKQYQEAAKEREEYRAKANSYSDIAHQAKTERDETRVQFADLKKRLHESEMENQRLRGYIQRVQEDDVVNEPLVTVGDPEGEQQQVPKRKSTAFFVPNEFTDFVKPDHFNRYASQQTKPKHWITY